MTFESFCRDCWEGLQVQTQRYINDLLGFEHKLKFSTTILPDGERALIIINARQTLTDIPPSYAIEAGVNINNPNIMAMKLLNNSYSDVFFRICWDLIESSKDAESEIDAFDLFIDRFLSWQKSLQINKGKMLSSYAVKGLFGEIYYFNKLLETITPKEALLAWQGPEGGAQDYLFADKWVELKTLSHEEQYVKISSLEQLDREDNGFLHVIFTSDNASDGEDICSLIEKTIELLPEKSDQDAFFLKLYRVGYKHENIDDYKTLRFKVTGEEEYVIEGDFPRVRSSSIPQGVSGIKYKISLATLKRFKV